MKQGLTVLLSLIVGAAVGSGVTYYICSAENNKKQDEFYAKEVEPARTMYLQKVKELETRKAELIEKNRIDKEKMLESYNDLNKAMDYVTDSNEVEKTEPNVVEPVSPSPQSQVYGLNGQVNAYPIDSTELGITGNDECNLVYYRNGIACDSNGNIIDDLERLIGQGLKDKLDEYISGPDTMPDEVWIRNDDISIDFAIQLTTDDFEG